MSDISYNLTQSIRRSITIRIEDTGAITVRAPRWISKTRIHAFVVSKQPWILKKKAELFHQKKALPSLSFDVGSYFLHLGRYYRLDTLEAPVRRKLSLGHQCFLISPDKLDSAETVFTKWYKEAATMYFEIRVAQIAQKHRLQFSQLKLSNAKTSWGACTSAGAIRLNWRLIMSPPSVIDYVICHELAHTVHMNHSPRFWKVVESMCPNWKLLKSWLGQNGKLLTVGGVAFAPETLELAAPAVND